MEFADKRKGVTPGFYFRLIDYYVNLCHEMLLSGLGKIETVSQ